MKRFIQLLIAGCFMCMTAVEVQAKIPVKANKTRLTDNWEFIRQDLGNVWEAVRPVRKGQPEELPLWQTVTLPHCFNAEDAVDPDVNYYQGPGWYRTMIKPEPPYRNGRIMLEFEGAGQKTDVYVYNNKVACHTGGYDSWNVDITDAVRSFYASGDSERFDGNVPLCIRCDNSRDTQMIPSDMSDFNVYGGIYRYLNLVYLPEVSVTSLRIEPQLEKNMKRARLTVKGTFYNPGDIRKATADIIIKDPEGNTVAAWKQEDITPLGNKILLAADIDKPVLWDVKAPALYTCEVSVTANGQTMTATERFGFRTFDFIEKGPFYLNGRRLLLQGTHRHEDHAGVGAAMTQEMMETELRMMKEMGVNFIRLGHYQQSETVLNLCDELGILVWEEIPWCRGGIGGEAYRNQAKTMLRNMIAQHYNHPAVIIWGLGNENDWPGDFSEFDRGEIRKLMSELNGIAHDMDSGRKTAIRRCEFCSDIVDVYSPSIWAGWYSGNYTDYKNKSEDEMKKVRHFLHVEWGGDSHAGRHAETTAPPQDNAGTGGNAAFDGSAMALKKGDWSETYFIKLIDWHLKEQQDMPWLTGTAFWTFKDFSTPIRPDNPVPYVNQKGVVERDFTKKESYYVFQSYWTDMPMVHIYGHNWPVRWGGKDEEKEILVYSNCEKVELFVNGKSAGTRKRDIRDYPAAGLRWNVRLKEGQNVIVATASNGKQNIDDKINIEYQTEKWGTEHAFQTIAVNRNNDMTDIHVQLVDKNGVRCLDSKKFITFGITGDGELIQNQGTVRGSRKVQACNGRASITVRHTGKACVSVQAEGVETEFVTLQCE